jgi:hypothetical protein
VISVDVPQIAAGREAIAHALLQGFDVGKAAVAPAFPDYVPVELDLKRAAGAGRSATSPISSLKVERSSCAIQAARKSQWHCVQ